MTGRRADLLAYGLAALLAGAGLLHFTIPEFYERLIPELLGSARAWVYGSGIAELAAAAGVAVRRTRYAGAWAAAALFVLVFPGNVYMAIHPGDTPRWAAIARLPLQIPLVYWAVTVARTSRKESAWRS